jgi:hypothetical protein
MFGLDLISQRTLVVLDMVAKAVQAVVLEEVAKAEMVVAAVEAADMNKMALLVTKVQKAIEAKETRKVADMPAMVDVVDKAVMEALEVVMQVSGQLVVVEV